MGSFSGSFHGSFKVHTGLAGKRKAPPAAAAHREDPLPEATHEEDDEARYRGLWISIWGWWLRV